MSLNSGPPRLRIDNVINLRIGTSVDDDFEARKRIPAPQPIPPHEGPAREDTPDMKTALGDDGAGESRGPSPEEGVVARDMAIEEHERDDDMHDDIDRKRQ